MARPLRIEYPGAVYHITSRGNARNPIFEDDQDRQLFLNIIEKVINRWGWIIHAYCLMGNHYHLLIETPEPNLSRGMRQLNGEYTQVFNRRHNQVGHIFQGRFKSILVEKESHLLELARYVVLNPVKARTLDINKPEDWPWSSFKATAGIIDQPSWLTVSWILSRFGKNKKNAVKKYKHFVADGLKEGSRIIVHSGLWIGSGAFGKRLVNHARDKEKVMEHPRKQRRVIERKELKDYFSSKALEDINARNEFIYMAYREGRYTQKAIGNYLGLHYVTISLIVRQKEDEMKKSDRVKAVN